MLIGSWIVVVRMVPRCGAFGTNECICSQPSRLPVGGGVSVGVSTPLGPAGTPGGNVTAGGELPRDGDSRGSDAPSSVKTPVRGCGLTSGEWPGRMLIDCWPVRILPPSAVKTGTRLTDFFSPPTGSHGNQMLYDAPNSVGE